MFTRLMINEQADVLNSFWPPCQIKRACLSGPAFTGMTSDPDSYHFAGFKGTWRISGCNATWDLVSHFISLPLIVYGCVPSGNPWL